MIGEPLITVASGRTRDGLRRGFIIPIGGAEQKLRDRNILTRFVQMCGGQDARIAVIPTASELPETGAIYEQVFKEIGVAHVRNFPFMTRRDCDSTDWLDELRTSTGVFMTGGNQLRLSTTIGGTKVGSLLRELSMRGAHIAGTSAGAGFLSEHMIAFGSEGSSPRANMVTLAPGLGLTNAVIVDHHFRERDRSGRLMTAVAYNPFAIGLGLDEDTAAFISPSDVLEVDGSGSVTLVDPSEVEYTSMDSAHQNDPVCLVGLRLHILTKGWRYDLHSRCASAPESGSESASAPESATETKPAESQAT